MDIFKFLETIFLYNFDFGSFTFRPIYLPILLIMFGILKYMFSSKGED